MRVRIVSVVLAIVLVVFGATVASAGKGGCPGSSPCVPPGPTPVTRLFTTGFEANSRAIDDLNTGTLPSGVTNDNTIARSGSRSLKFVPASGSAASTISLFNGQNFVRVYVRVTVLPGTARLLVGTINAGSTNIKLNPDGTLGYFNNTTLLGTTTTALTDTSRWYRVEFNGLTAAGTTELRIDGAAEVSSAQGSSLIADATLGASDSVAATYTAYFDDVAINDTNGGSQTSWPGDGRVVLLLPTADSARGTGWTTDSTGATNFFAATDNTPPTGIADTTAGSGLHQIRNATSNANSNYDATMTTYAAAGIDALDTINVIDPIVVTAAPVTTSAKAGTVGVVSNPTIANIALGAGGTAGAFWSGVAAGTYPTGWKISHGTLTFGSTVTVGTAPIMRITQVTSSTRIAMVCFMGMNVDYTPATTLIPHTSPYPPALAQ